MKAYINAWKDCLKWSGRTSRKDFWLFQAINIGIFYIIYLLDIIMGALSFIDKGSASIAVLSLIFLIVYGVLQLVPNIAIIIRRLHDVNKPGWYFLIGQVPVIGSIWLLIILCTMGTYGDNDFGPDPNGTIYYEHSENNQY